MQSRYYNPQIGRFINADSLVATGQGVLGNNMFAYCNNNPVILADASGTASKVCITADGAIDDSPWREISPSGGGHSYYVIIKNDYSGDLFYTQIALRYIKNALGYAWEGTKEGAAWLWDTYMREYNLRQEVQLQQARATIDLMEDRFSTPQKASNTVSLVCNSGLFVVSICAISIAAPGVGTALAIGGSIFTGGTVIASVLAIIAEQ